MNVAPVVFPAVSITSNTYVPFPVIIVPFVYVFQLSVAVTPELLSEKSILIPVV